MKVSSRAVLQAGVIGGLFVAILGLATTASVAQPARAALPLQPTTTGQTPTVESTATQETPTVEQTVTQPAGTTTTEPDPTSTPTPASTATATPATATATATAAATQAPPTATPTVATPTAQATSPAQATPTPVSPNVGNAAPSPRGIPAGWLIVAGMALAGASALGLAMRRTR